MTRQVQPTEDLPSVARAGSWCLLTSLAACLLLLFVANVAGAELEAIRTDGRSVRITFSSVATTLLLAHLAGVVALGLLGRRSRRAWIFVAVAGLVVGLASTVAPLASEAGVLTTFVLVAMHVVAGAVWFTVLMSMLPRR